MKTKIFSLVLLSFMALAIVSCDSTPKVEYRTAQDNISYCIKTINGKRQWGLVANVANPEYMSEVVTCRYDSIYSIHNILKYAFVGIKDGQSFAFDDTGSPLLDNQSFTSFGVVANDDTLNSAYAERNKLIKFACSDGNRFVTFDQYYAEPNGMQVSITGHPEYRTFGPFENFFAGSKGYAFSQNGKWGFYALKVGDKMIPGKGTYEVSYIKVRDAQYDAIIEIATKGSSSFWLVKTGQKWSALDEDGDAKRVSQAQINGYLKSKKTNWSEFNDVWLKGRQRVGSETVGCVLIPSGW